MQKFGIGQAATRIEDTRLTTGAGRYVDDVQLDNQCHALFVRSPHAHAAINSIDTADAEGLPGILGIYTVEDLKAAGINDIPCMAPVENIDGSGCIMPPRPALAQGRVRHVGDPVVLVVAETMDQARDAADAIFIDYDSIDSVVGTGEATSESAHPVWDQAPNNRCFDWQSGDKEGVSQAFADAAKTVEVELVNNRVIPNSMEARGAIASIEEGTGRMVLRVSCQGVHLMRGLLANAIFNVPEEQIHVVCDDVGGGFGMKIFLFPEYVAVLFAARTLGRPVRWISERTEAFMSDSHGRDHISRMRLALDADARILGLEVNTTANLGAYLSNFAPFVPTAAGVGMLVGCYDIPAAYVRVEGVFTNTAPVDAYRGAGRPEAIYAIERLLDVAASDLNIDPADIRRRNFISPTSMPYSTALGCVYDSGEFQQNLDDAVELADWHNFEQRRRDAAARGKLRGIGLASYIERCAGGAPEAARLAVDNQGHVTLFIGTQSNGQGHETAFRQILCERLGIAFEDVSIVQGDSDRIASGGGTMGSRSVPVGGAAITAAALKLIETARQTAAQMMETAVGDIEFEDGEFRVSGTDISRSFKSVAAAGPTAENGIVFDEVETFAPGEATYPNGTHVCEIEIDQDTAAIEVINFTVVDDFGKVINPLLLEGQVHGGIGQGLGQALLESVQYEEGSGQLLTATYMDYNMPRADNFCNITFKRNEVPCLSNPLGIKGAGEAGAIGAPPAIINALVNALRTYGIRHLDMPMTQDKMFEILQRRA